MFVLCKHCDGHGYLVVMKEYHESEHSDSDLLCPCLYCEGKGFIDDGRLIDENFEPQYQGPTFWSTLFNTDNLLNKIITLLTCIASIIFFTMNTEQSISIVDLTLSQWLTILGVFFCTFGFC